MKKIFSLRILLFGIFVIFLLGLNSYADSEFTYELDANNNAIITAYNGTEENLTIPSTIDGYNVKKIGTHAFDGRLSETNGKILKSVIVSEGITEIDWFAFLECTNLEKVVLPNSLRSMGMQTFLGCTKLKEINIPENVTIIGSSQFQETGLEEITIPESVSIIYSRAFGICNNLKKVYIYSRDVFIDDEVFYNCPSDLVLYGYVDSSTQMYAQENGITFKNIEEQPEPEPTPEPQPDPDPDPHAGIMVRVYLNKEKISLKVNETYTLEATVLEESKDNLVWTSSDETVVTVKDGKITAKKTGTATITASIGDVKDTCIVTVIKKESTGETPKNETPKDNTISTNPIPDAGMKNIILIILVISLLASYAYYKINKNYK